MAAPSSLHRWRLAAALAATALLGIVLLLVRDARAPEAGPPRAPSAVPTPPPNCDIPALTSVRALPHADGPPVLLWAAGDVRLYLDGKAAFSPPEAPRHFAVGEHTLRLEAEGLEPYTLQVRFDPWTPVLLHAERDPIAGLTLTRLEAACVGCPHALQPYEAIASRAPEQSTPLTAAAAALRRNAWPEALALLEQVPASRRQSRAFLRLESAVYADTYSSSAARRTLEAIDDADLRTLLAAHAKLYASEAQRRHEVQLERWNRTTERFAALMERWSKELPQAMASASERLAALSPVFETAYGSNGGLDAEEALQAAEAEILTITHRLRTARPQDCAFQAEVVATVTR